MINKQYFEIQELVEAIIDNRGKTVPTSENGIPLIATNCIKHSSIFPTFENIRYINQETYDNWFRAHLKPNDILFVNKGTPGRCCIVPNPVNFVAAQDMVGLRFKKHLNPYYMLAVLRSKEIQNTIENNHVGLVIAHFRKQELVKLKLPILEETIRNKIGDFYEIISKKIELNNRINAELEAMAKTLYDYWFVQFDFPNSPPLEGWQNSKNFDGVVGYKSSGGKMVYNETLKREIPEGWEVKRLEEIEEKIITGKTPSTKIAEYFNGNIPFITIDDIRKQFYIFNAERNLTISGAESQVNKYVYSGDICVSCIGTIGIIGIVATTSQTNQQINTISQIKDYNRYFLLNSLKNYFEYNVGAKKGAVLDNMNKQEFSNIPILDANKHLKELYFDKVNPLYEKIKLNLKQNQELSALRDWLLPMLMNGQVKVG
jgi:type I restriction enzyme S subunit